MPGPEASVPGVGGTGAMRVELDATDRKLLNLLQRAFPLEPRPFARVGVELEVGEDEVLRRVARLKEEGPLRWIGAIFQSARLGYRSTLAAGRVPPERLDEVATVVSGHPGVSHNYARNHRYNLWFTLAVPPDRDVDDEMAGLARRARSEPFLSLPAVEVFKIGVFFDLEASPSKQAEKGQAKASSEGRPLSRGERDLVRALQSDLPVTQRPFHRLGGDFGLDEEELVEGASSLLAEGIMRRYGALLRHRQAGFTANAMSCWVVPSDLVPQVGNRMAACPEVSHCYQRQTGPDWPYNLFAMIHGRTRQECEDVVQRIAQETGISEHATLYSVREFKKERVLYFMEEE